MKRLPLFQFFLICNFLLQCSPEQRLFCQSSISQLDIGEAIFNQSPFQPASTTLFKPMTIFVNGAKINGVDLPVGAEIGVFCVNPGTGNLVCVGMGTITQQNYANGPVSIKASMNDGSNGTNINGFIQGNDLHFNFYLPDLGVIDIVSVSFPVTGYDYTFQPQGIAFVSLYAIVTTSLFSVVTQAEPTEGGIIAGGGIYLSGSNVSLTATPIDGYRFYGWYAQDSLVSQNPVYSFEVSTDRAITAKFFSLRPPPKNLNAEVNQNDVTLHWDKPEFSVEGNWKHWDTGENHHSIGKNFGGTFRYAAKWDNLFQYQGWVVNKVAFFPAEQDAEFTLKVWMGDNATNLVVSQTVADFVANEWNEVFLNTPVPINIFEELWVGFECEHQANQYPAGCDNGPVNPFYGDLISFDGQTWRSLKYHYNLNYDWNIQVWIEHDIYQREMLPSIIEEQIKSGDDTIIARKNLPSQAFNNIRTEFLGYNVYRGNVRIGEKVSDTIFTETSVCPGNHYYAVKAVYDQGQSLPSEAAPVTIDTIENMQYQISSGWAGFSTLIIPSDTLLNNHLLQFGDTLLAIANLDQLLNPQQDSILSQTGYFIKLQENTLFSISGNKSFNRFYQLKTGWNLIPNLSTCEFSPLELIISGNYKMIKEAAGIRVFWPEQNVYSLDLIKPGRAYLILMDEPGYLEFPNCYNY